MGMVEGAGRILPGLPQLVRGKVLEGALALLLWAGLLLLGLARLDRVVGTLSGDVDDWIALLTLLLTLAGVWIWSRRESVHAYARSESRTEASGPLCEGWRAFRRNRMAVLGLGVVCGLYLVMLLTPLLAPYEMEYRPAFQAGGDMSLQRAPPSLLHFMGTDSYSQDVFTRILYGSRISLSVGLLSVAISVTLGTFLGAVAGYMGRIADTVIMRLVDMVMAFPRIVLLIAIVALFQPSIFVIIGALALTQWPFVTRLVRGEILALKEREFAEAAKALGFSRSRVLFRHLLPNALGPVIVVATLGVGHAILLEAGLSFLGLGVGPDVPSWGSMVDAGRDYLGDAWWMSTFPGLSIVVAVLAFNLVGDGLRDALDPRQEGRAAP